MLMAARRLQGIGLVLLLLMFAMALYPLSLRVASKRSELANVEREIVRTRDNIRYLETELGARASLRQLERWNAETFAYSAPVAGQYLESERQLAMVGAADPKLAQLAVVAPVEIHRGAPVDAAATAPMPTASVKMASGAPVVPAVRVAAAAPAPRKTVASVAAKPRGDLLDRLAASTATRSPALTVKAPTKPAQKLAKQDNGRAAPIKTAAAGKTPTRKPAVVAAAQPVVRLAQLEGRQYAVKSRIRQAGEPEGRNLLETMVKSAGSRRTP